MKILNDLYDRYFSYIRLSITDLCNFNCNYCLPEKNKKFIKKNFLSFYEIYNLISALSDLGVNKIRLTGGEPTIRKDFIRICKLVSSFKNIKFVVLTTNGYKLNDMISNIYKSGVTGINVSLDTLNKHKFLDITNREYFLKVYDGILKALDFNISIKLNIVLSDFFSLSDFETFYSLLRYKKISIRFIDQMETNLIKKNFKNINMNYIHAFLKKNNWVSKDRFNSDGPAIIFKNKKFAGDIGIINPYSTEFCKTCNRLRISSTGKLYLCLFGHKSFDIRNYLDKSEKKEDLKSFLLKKIKFKVGSHYINYNKFGLMNTFSSLGG